MIATRLIATPVMTTENCRLPITLLTGYCFSTLTAIVAPGAGT